VALLDGQSKALAALASKGQLTEHNHLELARTISLLVSLQGQAERIKNFPYPRQFATLNLVFVWLFILLLPFGIISEFIRVGDDHQWLTIPVTVTVAWVIHSMDKIGEASSNPFEGGPNDTPITAMSRGIEIDLRDLLLEKDLPAPLTPVGNILL
jgi:putative membrane protein